MFQLTKSTSSKNMACQAPHLDCKVKALFIVHCLCVLIEQMLGKQQDPWTHAKFLRRFVILS